MRVRLFFALVAITLSAVIPASALGVKFKSSGVYVDSSGTQHPWSISDTHTLTWDNAPYLPVGSAFAPRSVVVGADGASFDADTSDLQALKSKGITDVILKSPIPITSTDAAAWQKLISYLDANGFAYGIEMNDGPRDALQGYLVSPNRYRLEGPWPDPFISCDWPGVDLAIYMVVRKSDYTIIEKGGATLKDGKAVVRLSEPLASGSVLIIYPHKSFANAAQGSVGDLWSGFGEYRDRTLAFMKNIKFGQGLRFFLEPFTGKMDFTGEMNGFIPDSSGFRLGFEAFLTRKYTHEGGMNNAWAMSESLKSIEEGTRMMPLWGQGRGLAYLYDRTSASLYTVDPSTSQYWRDVTDYRDSSAQQYMNGIADALHKQVASVPVLFKSGAYHRIYANPFGAGGFDGLGAVASGSGDSGAVRSVGPAYSLAEESGKTTWFILADGVASAKSGYSDQSAMTAALDSYREAGCKGFYIENLFMDPRQIEWLASLKGKLASASAVEFKPTVINYPVAPNTGAYTRRLAPNTWWLPSLLMGRTSYIGDGLTAYSLAGEDRCYLWSGSGNKTVTMKALASGPPSVEFPTEIATKPLKGGTYSVALSDTPTVLRGTDISMVFPKETADDEIAKLAALIPQADKAGIVVQKARDMLKRASDVLSNGQFASAYDMARASMMELLGAMGPDIWLEGEQASAQSFDGSLAAPGASNGLALVLDTDANPPLAPYTADYRFEVPGNATYDVWIAGTPPGQGSPLVYNMDDMAPVSIADGSSDEYAPGLAWYKAGSVNLYPGIHTLRFKVDGKRAPDNRYYFAIDAIVLSSRGFKPNGVNKPY